MSIPAKVTVDLEIINYAVPGAFVCVYLSSVALLTGTQPSFLSGFKLRYVSHIFSRNGGSVLLKVDFPIHVILFCFQCW